MTKARDKLTETKRNMNNMLNEKKNSKSSRHCNGRYANMLDKIIRYSKNS
jgi:hypothetical protein|tara:strand:+ start:5716 stop:5865 length:150 start_codon:yes stop_codon:yes gene_type:complete